MSMLDVLRLLFSKEARETIGDVLARLRASPEWKQELVLINEKFKREESNHIEILVGHVQQLLASKDWDEEDIMRVRFVCLELAKNAFEHGLQAERRGSVSVSIQASPQFLEMTITDPGPGFDLDQELERQGAKNPRSHHCRALGFIYRQASELLQIPGKKNAIRVVVRKSLKPCGIEHEGDVVVFRFQGETQPSGYFWAHIVQQIEDLPDGSKVLLDFADVDDVSSRVISEISALLMKHDLPFEKPQDDLTPTQVLSELELPIRVVVCGLESVNIALRQFLKERFRTFDDVDKALEYFADRD